MIRSCAYGQIPVWFTSDYTHETLAEELTDSYYHALRTIDAMGRVNAKADARIVGPPILAECSRRMMPNFQVADEPGVFELWNLRYTQDVSVPHD